MSFMRLGITTAAASMVVTFTPASAQVVNFDDITLGASVDSFYNGGTSSAGDIGPDLDIEFQAGDWIAQTAFGQTSAPNLAYSLSGTGYVNFLSGITTGLNFSYGGFSDTTFNVYDGLGGTGNLLASVVLPSNDPFNFDFVAVPFSGTAYSIQIAGGASQFGWDDLTFGSLTPGGAVPEPTTWAMLLFGFAGIGAAMRRQRKTSATVAYQL